MKELVIQYIYATKVTVTIAFLSNNGYSMTAAVLAVECQLDQSLLQTTPPGDDLETIVTNYNDHKISTPQIIVPPVKRTRKKNWIIMEPHVSSVTMATPINSFERKRPHDPQMSGLHDLQMTGSHDNNTADQPHPPVSKRLCPSPRKSGTPRKHNVTPPIDSCDLVHISEEPGPSNQGDVQLPGNSSNGDIVDMELLQSVINDTQLPQQLANSINAALQSVNSGSIATGGSHDTVETSDNLVDKILENTQSDLLELLTELLPHDDNND